MAIGSIGFFGRGDLMRQRMYWNAQRYAMPLSAFAQGQVVDVGTMPGSVEQSPADQPQALPAVSGYGSFDGWGRVSSGQILSAAAGLPLGPAGVAMMIARNNKSLAHARKQMNHFKKLWMKLRAKNKNDKRIAKVKAKYEHWKRVYAHLVRKKAALQKARAHKKFEKRYFKKVKKAVRRGQQAPLTPAQRRRLRAQQQIIATSTMRRRMGLQTGAQAAASAGLIAASAQGAMVPPGSYDYLSATPLAPVSSSMAYQPSQLVAQDVDINDDGIRDDIPYSTDAGPGGAAEMADDGTMTDTGEDEGIMDKVSNFFGGIPKWALILGVLGIAGFGFSRTRQGKLAFAKLKRKMQGRGSAEA
jgi:hypothetical protein